MGRPPSQFQSSWKGIDTGDPGRIKSDSTTGARLHHKCRKPRSSLSLSVRLFCAEESGRGERERVTFMGTFLLFFGGRFRGTNTMIWVILVGRGRFRGPIKRNDWWGRRRNLLDEGARAFNIIKTTTEAAPFVARKRKKKRGARAFSRDGGNKIISILDRYSKCVSTEEILRIDFLPPSWK